MPAGRTSSLESHASSLSVGRLVPPAPPAWITDALIAAARRRDDTGRVGRHKRGRDSGPLPSQSVPCHDRLLTGGVQVRVRSGEIQAGIEHDASLFSALSRLDLKSSITRFRKEIWITWVRRRKGRQSLFVNHNRWSKGHLRPDSPTLSPPLAQRFTQSFGMGLTPLPALRHTCPA